MNQTQLAAAVAKEAGVKPDVAGRVIRAMADVIARRVIEGEAVNVTNFGTWAPAIVDERKYRNPHTGKPVVVPAYLTVEVQVAPRFAEVVRAGDPEATTQKRPKTKAA